MFFACSCLQYITIRIFALAAENRREYGQNRRDFLTTGITHRKRKREKVYEFFAGENIYFSKKIGKNETRAAIYAELCAGQSYMALAVKYGYTKSYIRKIQHSSEKGNGMRDRRGGKTAADSRLVNVIWRRTEYRSTGRRRDTADNILGANKWENAK
jgi:hypothetical protein